MQKTYNPKEFEDRIYKTWLEKKYFHATIDADKTPFTMMMQFSRSAMKFVSLSTKFPLHIMHLFINYSTFLVLKSSIHFFWVGMYAVINQSSVPISFGAHTTWIISLDARYPIIR